MRATYSPNRRLQLSISLMLMLAVVVVSLFSSINSLEALSSKMACHSLSTTHVHVALEHCHSTSSDDGCSTNMVMDEPHCDHCDVVTGCERVCAATIAIVAHPMTSLASEFNSAVLAALTPEILLSPPNEPFRPPIV